MSGKQFLKNVLKTSNVPKVNDAISFKESFGLNVLWAKKTIVPHGKFKSLRDLRGY